MKLKQYQQIKLVFVVILAMLFSQTLVLKNYIIPIFVMILGSLILWVFRSRVKEVIADERDYAIAGKSAMIAMQVYVWIATVAMFIFYANRDYNPAYEAIGMTLAFSICLLLFIYSFVFKYYNKIKFTKQSLKYAVVALIISAFCAVVAVRLFSGEDNWICENGQWVKHGQPSFLAPANECKLHDKSNKGI